MLNYYICKHIRKIGAKCICLLAMFREYHPYPVFIFFSFWEKTLEPNSVYDLILFTILQGTLYPFHSFCCI